MNLLEGRRGTWPVVSCVEAKDHAGDIVVRLKATAAAVARDFPVLQSVCGEVDGYLFDAVVADRVGTRVRLTEVLLVKVPPEKPPPA